MQEISRKRDANKTYMSRERSIERKMCQQTRMSRGQRCRVVETQRDRAREREIKRRSCQGKGPSKKNRDVLLVQKAFTETRHAKCLARTPRVLEESNLLLETPANRLVQALLVEIHLLAATLSSFRKQPFVEQNGAKKYDSSETSLIF
jgi:hypothetical protein